MKTKKVILDGEKISWRLYQNLSGYFKELHLEKKVKFCALALILTLSLKSQTITHTYHLTPDSLSIDSITTVAYYKDTKVFEKKEAVSQKDAQDLTQYHYFLGLIAIVNYKYEKK